MEICTPCSTTCENKNVLHDEPFNNKYMISADNVVLKTSLIIKCCEDFTNTSLSKDHKCLSSMISNENNVLNSSLIKIVKEISMQFQTI